MWVLFFGDVVGKPGRRAVASFLTQAAGRRDVDLVIANAENAAGGVGITEPVARELYDAGVDVLTSGNHIWDKKEGIVLLDREERLLRPANYPPGVEGRGWGVFRGRSGASYAIVSLIGRVFMGHFDDPFRCINDVLPEISQNASAVVVDFHAEATSEKRAMGYHLDGKVAAVVGTHTHVQTADAQVMSGGTGYITDVGMCGPVHSIIGMDPRQILRRFYLQTPMRFEVAAGEPMACGVFLDVDTASGRCRAVEPFSMRESQMRSPVAWKQFQGP
jgi:2',3'-cyclic-nucleotide 2'-phosphodiesterase